MYTEEDMKNSRKETSGFIWKLVGIAALMAGFWVLACILRIDLIGYAASVAAGIGGVLLWGVKGSELFSYRKFLKDLQTSRKRELSGTVRSIDGPVYVRRDLMFMEMIVESDDEDESEDRKIYFDCRKWPENIRENDHVRFNISSNVVVDILE